MKTISFIVMSQIFLCGCCPPYQAEVRYSYPQRQERIAIEQTQYRSPEICYVMPRQERIAIQEVEIPYRPRQIDEAYIRELFLIWYREMQINQNRTIKHIEREEQLLLEEKRHSAPVTNNLTITLTDIADARRDSRSDCKSD